MSSDKLTLPEWAVIATAAGAMLGISIASTPPNDYQIIFQKDPVYIQPCLIDISIAGAVSAPGQYRVPTHSTVKDALALTALLPEAKVDKIKWDSRVRQGQVIRVAKKRKKSKKSDSSIVKKSAVC